MDFAEIFPTLMMMQLLPALLGGAGSGGGVASDNVIILPVAIGSLNVNGGGPTLPVGVERDRRGSGRDRRNRPGGGGRRMADQLGPLIFGPPDGIPFVPPFMAPNPFGY